MADYDNDLYEEPLPPPSGNNLRKESKEPYLVIEESRAKKHWIPGLLIFLAIFVAVLCGIDIYLIVSLGDVRAQLNSVQSVQSSDPAIPPVHKTTPATSAVNPSNLTCSNSSGVTRIYPEAYREKGTLVYCDNVIDGGGWIIFQRREDGSVNFTRNWLDYVNGFGNMDREFWLGLDRLHHLLLGGNHELRVDIVDWEGNRAYASYSTFSVANSSDNYRLHVGLYSGTAGDSLSYHDNQQFSTYDRDNDHSTTNCAQKWKSGWWYNNCRRAHLNGVYYDGSNGTTGSDGVIWYQRKESWAHSLKFTEMKFRRIKNK